MATEAELIAEISGTIQRIRDTVQTLENAVNSGLSALSFFLGWIADRVRDGWNWFIGKLTSFWNWLTNITSHMGSPDALSATADAWSNTVGGPVSQEVQNADAGALLVDDKWVGDAADLYKQILPMQKSALDKIKSGFADGVSSALSALRTAIFVFWAALIVALAGLIVGLIGAIASADTIIGLPGTPVIAAGAVAFALAACWIGSQNLKSAAASANSQLRQKVNDNSAFLDGHWPPGVLH